MSDNLGILCFYSDIIVNTDNDFTYNEGSHEFLIATSNMSLNELSRMLGDWLDYNMLFRCTNL
jgi:hypothetical protein